MTKQKVMLPLSCERHLHEGYGISKDHPCPWCEIERLRAALTISRGQWIHSVNARQCLEALGVSPDEPEDALTKLAGLDPHTMTPDGNLQRAPKSSGEHLEKALRSSLDDLRAKGGFMAEVQRQQREPSKRLTADDLCSCGKRMGEHPVQPPWWPCMLRPEKSAELPCMCEAADVRCQKKNLEAGYFCTWEKRNAPNRTAAQSEK